jgi:hypothetical protein
MKKITILGKGGTVVRRELVQACLGLLLLVFLSPAHRALAWGPITHTAINREASAGTMGRDFAMGGHSPDMIALRHVLTGDSRYDYAHNSYGSNKEPLFGRKMIRAYKGSKHRERYGGSEREFAYGWAGHQIADGFAHGSGGYSEIKETFQKLPEAFRKSLNHGAAELIVDAIVTEEVFRGNAILFVPNHADLIHEASVVFYNEVKTPSNSHTILRKNIIDCGTVEKLTRRWREWLLANEFLAKLASGQPWFKEARQFYADYKGPFASSVYAIKNFLKRPDAVSNSLLPLFNLSFSSIAYAAEEEEQPGQLPSSSYYRFVSRLADEAKKLGGGKITDESLRLALPRVIQEDSQSDLEETRAWAKFMEELYLKDNQSFKEIIEKVERQQKVKVLPVVGSRSNKIPWLFLGMGAALVVLAVGWLVRAIKK